MAWTDEQQRAIFDRGQNIIVSAGAGSGKTAVLSERILEYCKNGGDIRRILVLTFTKAAAMEMKERIRKKLIDNDLLVQADYIDAAYITTFDSYSLSLVKKYYYKLDIAPDVSIMDTLTASMKRSEIIDSLFKEYYEANYEPFLNFLRKYTTQDDTAFKKMIKAICDKLDLLINIDDFIGNYGTNYLNNAKINSIVDDYVAYSRNKVNSFINSVENLLDIASTDSVSAKLYDTILESLNNLKSDDDYTALYNAIRCFKLGTVSSKADPRVKEEKLLVADELKELKEKVFDKYAFTEDMRLELIAIKGDILFLLDTCREILDRLFAYKKSINLFSFSDIARLAIKLVYENDDVMNELKDYYNEILVDEYQDTSDMQEVFLSRIENNNRYMVGDIKQSIYRFRNANPYIFKDKYDNYSQNNGGEKIDLTFNFRSRSEVLDNINLLFNKLMTNSCGDANYKEDHQMRYGQKGYEGISQDIDFNLEVLKYEVPDDYKFSAEEREAFIVGKKIKEILASKPKVLKGSSFIDAQYSDFAILIDKAKSFVTFKQIFEYLGIPLSIEADLDLKDSIIPLLFANILFLIDYTKNKKYDKADDDIEAKIEKKKYHHAKVSLARSFLYEYSDNDIYNMTINNQHMPIDDDIYYLAKLKNISYSTLFYEICNRLNIYDKLGLIGNVDNSLIILDNIHNIMNSFTKCNMTISEAAKYLADAFNSDIKMPYTLIEGNKDSVRIMTIHKSKGLEFAYCFFPLLGSSFNDADQKAETGLDSDYGIYIPFSEDGKSNTIIKPLVANKIKLLDISERIRLLYVALTRAREKMFLILEDKEYKNLNPKKFKSFSQMLAYTDVFEAYTKRIDLNDYDITFDYKKGKISEVAIKGIDTYSYNDIKRMTPLHKSRISKDFKEIPDKKTQRAMDMGTLIHEALEVIDFNNPDYEGLPVEDYIKDYVKGVLEMPILANRAKAKIFHEHEFYMTHEGEEYHGIIDLFLEYDDHIDIIDYKLSGTDSKEYIRQLEIYKMYVSSKSRKKIDCYLLSIMNREVVKLDI